MAKDHQPFTLHKPTPAEELAKLHPLERALLRAFEFFSSLKLAVTLMLWLVLECTAGTFIESQVNAGAARFFVYESWRFVALLLLLALNILCAALIRFPWKLRQTGFVVTHSGLLLLLAGSMMTWRNNLDTLMSVAKDKSSSSIMDVDAERLVVDYFQPSRPNKPSKTTETEVKFGPFTWGHKLWGAFPWRPGRVETIGLETGDAIRVKQFYGNCEPRGVSLRYRLRHQERGIDTTDWVEMDWRQPFGGQRLPMGTIRFWQLDTQAQFDHFVYAAPTGPSSSLLGVLGYSHNGKHHLFNVDDLRKGPVEVPNSGGAKVRLVEYLPNGPRGGPHESSEQEGVPEDPLLKLEVIEPSGATQRSFAYGRRPEESLRWSTLLGADHQFTYFPNDLGATIHLVATPDGQIGYRAFGSNGPLAAVKVELGKEYPGWAGQTFAVERHHPRRLQEKPLKRGKDGHHGLEVEFESKGKTYPAVLLRPAGQARDQRDVFLTLDDGRRVGLRYEVKEYEVPFSILLKDFHEPKNPGTNAPAMFTSVVELNDPQRNVKEEHIITMNAPLRYLGTNGVWYTLYQSGIDHSTGTPISTYTVANDPGLVVKYTGLLVMSFGIFLMFYMNWFFKRSWWKRTPRPRSKLETEAERLVLVNQ